MSIQTISVSASRSYDILVGRGAVAKLTAHKAGLSRGERCAVITDDHVAPLHLNSLTERLEQAGVEVFSFVLPHGEESKNMRTLADILSFLSRCRLTRTDTLVALGGGVVGDITGLAAALYLRGVDLIQIPTTLLACVDSSVGGKCAVDLPEGKNLVGTFYQPRLVLCDLDLLDTLPEEEWSAGAAEVIKYALGFDRELFSLCEGGIRTALSDIVCRCIELKRDTVEHDEFDRAERKKLNLGHTVAHAVELLSDYKISHGRAVAMGLALITRACLPDACARLEALLHAHGLETASPYPTDALARAARGDKKCEGDTLSLIVPTDIGACEIRELDVDALAAVLSEGLR